METTPLLWGLLVAYGALMWFLAPKARKFEGFFAGRDSRGREVGLAFLTASVVISWIFAKSITNAANLGYTFGAVGAVAYAGWYVSIPVAGWVIYKIRLRLKVGSLAEFVRLRHGRAAVLAFMLVILARLMNEVWSNTAVVGAYFGATGTAPYYAAALLFAAMTLAYSLRGGLRSSVFTDMIQFALAVFLLVFVLGLVVPRSGAAPLATAGEWTLKGGVDLLLVALLQSFSYPFHDPVLTDRGFITRPKVMLMGFILAGVVAAAFIVVFGMVGVFARVEGLAAGQDAPLQVARAFGVAMLAGTSALMMISAGSTLDSTLSSFSKAAVVDLGGAHAGGAPGAPGTWMQGRDPVALGRRVMVAAVLVGSLPLFTGAAIIKATTVSGTMVLGLAPVFLLYAWRRPGPWAFHLALWPGVLLGVLHALNRIPPSWNLGEGTYAGLLGANVLGTLLVFAGFLVGALLDRRGARGARVPVLALAAAALLAPSTVQAADKPSLALSGQTMFRVTAKLRDLDRPAAEVYNIRLVGRAEEGPYRFLTEVRFRQSKLRSFSPSNVWIQQAYAAWTTPVSGLTVSGGLLYNQLGLFWDRSWFGNLPYLNGHKLDPDMNLQLEYQGEPLPGLDWRLWLQGSPGDDGLNGTFATGGKLERLALPPDVETSSRFREAVAFRARNTATFRTGAVGWTPGLSLQVSGIDRAATDSLDAATGSQVVAGAELTVEIGRAALFVEGLAEKLSDLTAGDAPRELRRRYFLAGGEFLLRETGGGHLKAGFSYQAAEYPEEGLEEWFLTARLTARLNGLLGVTAEYVRWELSEASRPEVDRVELILHVYY